MSWQHVNTTFNQIILQGICLFLTHQQYGVIFRDIPLLYSYFASFQKTVFDNHSINLGKHCAESLRAELHKPDDHLCLTLEMPIQARLRNSCLCSNFSSRQIAHLFLPKQPSNGLKNFLSTHFSRFPLAYARGTVFRSVVHFIPQLRLVKAAPSATARCKDTQLTRYCSSAFYAPAAESDLVQRQNTMP